MLKHVCHPGTAQRDLYSGHKRRHGVKYQHVMCPNGLVCHAWGPFIGRKHDISMFNESGLEADLVRVHGSEGETLSLYGDGGYVQRNWLQVPFKGAFLTREQKEFNVCMSHIRASVEWGFGKVSSIWAFVNYYANQKVFLQPVGMYFLAASLFANCHTTLYGSEISSYFALQPPSLEEYLQS